MTADVWRKSGSGRKGRKLGWVELALAEPKKSRQRKDQDVTRNFTTRSAILIFSLVVGVSISQNAEAVTKFGKSSEVSVASSFILAQTSGMNRRSDRRGDRQDCRQNEGAVGQDKRACKQAGRQTR
jgi:hypothetical protein